MAQVRETGRSDLDYFISCEILRNNYTGYALKYVGAVADGCDSLLIF